MSDDLSISQRRKDVLSRIKAAANWAKRDEGEITLVAVSKQQPDARIKDMLAAGQTVFGENRVQEAVARWGDTFKARRENIDLRLIGPLQSNKAVDAVRLFDVIETLDRDKLAKAIVNAANKVGRMPKLFVQVNTGEEPQKSGIIPSELPAFLKRLKTEYNLTADGLMCIPPAGEAASPHFWFLKNMAEDNDLALLSMGMSGDFETAIKMGTTHVRVGSALFGGRNP